ncbi:hypothetical protein CVM50_02305 [Pseudooceanicola marinus]|nr:hypothetical protein CVM50_02305 [Pseudooceanicola marinus]
MPAPDKPYEGLQGGPIHGDPRQDHPCLAPQNISRRGFLAGSGAQTGGVGEPDLPAVPPAALNTVARLTGQRVCSLPIKRQKTGAICAGLLRFRLCPRDQLP